MAKDDYSYLDHINCPVFVLEPDASGQPVYRAMNAFACNSAGRKLSDFLGHTAAQVYGGTFGQIAYGHHCRAFNQGQTIVYELDLPIAGEILSLRTTLSPVRDSDGKVCRIFGSSLNVSDLRAANQARMTFQTLSSEMEQFVTMAAHDLRTPMRNVAVLADMLRDNFDDRGDGKLDMINMLEDLAQKSMALITDVLAHARALGAGVAADVTLFNIADLLRDIVKTLDPLDQHELVCDDVNICADSTVFQIVLRNLIDNAFKHAGRGRVRVEISVRAKLGDMIEVTLRDNGKGLPNPGQAFLQSGQFQVDSGYGLLGIKRLVTARGGDITAQNDPKEGGTVICFALPGVWVAPMGDNSTQASPGATDTVGSLHAGIRP